MAGDEEKLVEENEWKETVKDFSEWLTKNERNAENIKSGLPLLVKHTKEKSKMEVIKMVQEEYIENPKPSRIKNFSNLIKEVDELDKITETNPLLLTMQGKWVPYK